MTGWLKAGLIGIVILIVLNLIGLIPVLGCITLPLILITYIIVGVMAAMWTQPPRSAGSGAGQGALAALIASLGSGIVNLIITLIRASTGAIGRQLFSQIPPEVLQQLQQSGLPSEFFLGMGGAAVIGSVCCVLGLFVAAVLGAVGGAIYAATKPGT
jgi:hypothetical protein